MNAYDVNVRAVYAMCSIVEECSMVKAADKLKEVTSHVGVSFDGSL